MIIITVARKPYPTSATACILDNGCGGLNINACRIGYGEAGPDRPHSQVITTPKGGEEKDNSPTKLRYDSTGRWPSNLFLCDISREPLDKQSFAAGIHSAGHAKAHDTTRSNGAVTSFGGGDGITNGGRYGDSGGASRFFKVFK